MKPSQAVREADDRLDGASVELEAAHQAVLDAEARRSAAHKAWQDALMDVRRLERAGAA